MSQVSQSTDYILTWNSDECRILSQSIKFTSNARPELPFGFDSLYYETPTGNAFKLTAGVRHELTAEEIVACRAYCEQYATTAAYPVQAYDADGIYLGEMLRPEAAAKNLGYRIVEIPDHPASKWTGETWERIVAVIMEDGSLRLMPDALCLKCVLPMTQAEWDAFPKPEKDVLRWSFINEAWEDNRKLEQLKVNAGVTIRNVFEGERWRVWGKYIPQYEQDTWIYQIDEAMAYMANPEVETPYIDAFLAARTDGGKPTKADLCTDIIANNNAYKLAVAGVNGQQWNWLKQVETATSNVEVDAILEELALWDKGRQQALRN